MSPPLTLLSDYRGAFIFANPSRHRSAITHTLHWGSRARGPWTSVRQSLLGTELHRQQPKCSAFASAWLVQGHRENLWWSKTKDVRLHRAPPHSEGWSVTLRQSFAACHWDEWLCDPSQKYPVFSSAFYICTFILFCMPESNIIYAKRQ